MPDWCRPPWRAGLWLCLLASLASLAQAWYFLVQPDFLARTVIYNVMQTLFDGYAAIICWRHGVGRRQQTFRVLSVLLWLLSLSNVVKTVASLHFGIDDILSDSPWNKQYFLCTLFYVAISSPLFVLLIAQRLQEELDHEARHDPLTQAYNRRALGEFCDRECEQAGRHGYPVSFLMLDIDHFKRFNDTHGHQAGDLALQAMSRCAMACLRNGDLWSRYGGEEFVAVLPHADGEEALAVAERLRHEIAGLSIIAPAGRLGLTVSVGVAEKRGSEQHCPSNIPPSLHPIPHPAPAPILLQMIARGQVAKMLLQRVAAGPGQLDGIHHRDAPVLPGEFHNLQ